MNRRRQLGTWILILGALTAAPAAAQRFGQWWWDGGAGVKLRSFDNLVDDEIVNGFDQTDLALSFGVNGYILHPSFAQFRFGLDALFTSLEGSQAVDSERTGYDAELRLLPRGRYALFLRTQKRLFEYSDLPSQDPLALRGTPDTLTTWEGRLRIRGGLLKGSMVGFESSALDFLQEGDQRLEERQYYDWTSAGHRFQRHALLEREYRDFGSIGYATENLSLTFDQHGQVFTDWRWDVFGVAIHRDLDFENKVSTNVDSFRLRSTLVHEIGRNLLRINYNSGLAQATSSETVQSHSIVGRYILRRFKGWEITPFAGFALQSSARVDLQAPQAGVEANFSGRFKGWDLWLSDRVSYLFLDRSGERSGSETSLAMASEFTLGRGREDRLRQELELSYNHNELRAAGETVSDLPDLGVTLSGLGTEDSLRGRLTLRRRWSNIWAMVYGEWSQRVAEDENMAEDFTLDNLTYTFQVSGRRFSLTANVGDVTADRFSGTIEKVSYTTATLTFRPWRWLSFGGSYRTDQRQLELAPDLDGERVEANLELRFGEFQLQGLVFESNERFLAGGERTNRGMTVSLTRRLAGWLPVVTGPERRGVIR